MPDAIHLNDLTLARRGRVLLDRLSWRVPVGGCSAVLGANGAGKSTLLAVIGGYLWPQQGSVEVLGERYGQVDLSSFRRRMGVLGHSRLPEFHPELSVYETVLAGRWGAIVPPPHHPVTPADEEAARRELRLVGLGERAGDDFGALSTGEQMRTLLARALVGEPELLILDEPTSVMDMAARAMFAQALDRLIAARPALTIVIVTHYTEDLPRRTREVLLLRAGRAVASGPIKTTLTSEFLSATFGCEVQVHAEDGRYWTRVLPNQSWDLAD